MSDTTTMQPTEGPCDRCKQTRPLFPYEPDHDGHIDPYGFTCRWCTRTEQPNLCTRCWGVERLEEESDPALNEEAEMLGRICATNAAWTVRCERDKATVAGIAAASGMDGAK
jgi:hypothetical protein